MGQNYHQITIDSRKPTKCWLLLNWIFGLIDYSVCNIIPVGRRFWPTVILISCFNEQALNAALKKAKQAATAAHWFHVVLLRNSL